MDTGYMGNTPPPGNPHHADFWRNSSFLPPTPRYDLPMGRNPTDYQGYQMVTKDYDPLPYISIRPGSPNYRSVCQNLIKLS